MHTNTHMHSHTHTQSERRKNQCSLKREMSSSTTICPEAQSQSFTVTHSLTHAHRAFHTISSNQLPKEWEVDFYQLIHLLSLFLSVSFSFSLSLSLSFSLQWYYKVTRWSLFIFFLLLFYFCVLLSSTPFPLPLILLLSPLFTLTFFSPHTFFYFSLSLQILT